MSLLLLHDSEIAQLQRGTRRFIVWGAGLVLLVIMAILVRQGLFRQTTSMGFVAESALDISVGESVRFSGFKIGAVDRVTLRPDGQVDVQIEIDTDAMRFVTRDAVIELRREGLVGAAVLEVVPGVDHNKLAPGNSVLAFRRAETLTGIATGLRDRLVPILADTNTVTAGLADPQRGLAATLAEVQKTNASLRQLLQTGDAQVHQLGLSASRVMHESEQDLATLGRTLDTVHQRLPAMLDQAQSVLDGTRALMAQTQTVLGQVQSVTQEAERRVPGALRDTQQTASDVHDIVTGAKSTWPVRSLVEVPRPQMLPVDSDPHPKLVTPARTQASLP